jgi:hypothetical protein
VETKEEGSSRENRNEKSVLQLHFSLFCASLDLCHPPWTPLGQVIRLLAVSRETQIGTGTKHTRLKIPQCLVPHNLLQNISVHHYSNPDPSSDLTYHPWHTNIPQLHKPPHWGNPYPDQKIIVARFRAVFIKSYPRFNCSGYDPR